MAEIAFASLLLLNTADYRPFINAGVEGAQATIAQALPDIKLKGPILEQSIFENRVNWLADQMSQSMRDSLDKTITDGINAGNTYGMMADTIQQMLGINLNEAEDVGWRAERIARTESMWATNEAALQQYEAIGVSTVNILTAIDACDECNAAAAENPFQIQASADWLPIHPNCRCIWSTDFSEFTKADIEQIRKNLEFQKYYYRDPEGRLRFVPGGGVGSASDAALFAKTSAIKETLYHGSTPEVQQKILEHGFKADQEGMFGNAVYFTTNKQDAYLYGSNITEAKINVQSVKTVASHTELLSEANSFGVDLANLKDHYSRSYDAMKITEQGYIAVFNPEKTMAIKPEPEKSLQKKWVTLEDGRKVDIGNKLSDIGQKYDTKQVWAARAKGHEFEKLSSGGSGRDVYVVSDGAVVKVAKSPLGLRQNDSEGDYVVADHMPKVLEKGMDYVVAERAMKDVPVINQFLKPLQQFTVDDFDAKTPALQEAMTNMGVDNFMNYDLLWNDFKATRNWGTIDGKPVLVDAGALNRAIHFGATPDTFTLQDWQEVLSARRAARKNIEDAKELLQKYYYHDATGQLRYVPGEEKINQGKHGLTQSKAELNQKYERMKHNAALEMERSRDGIKDASGKQIVPPDPTIPQNIREIINSVDISGAKDPIHAAKMILDKIPKVFANHPQIKASLTHWGKTFHMLLYSRAHPEVIPKSINEIKENRVVKASYPAGAHWVTIKGEHVLLDAKGNQIDSHFDFEHASAINNIKEDVDNLKAGKKTKLFGDKKEESNIKMGKVEGKVMQDKPFVQKVAGHVLESKQYVADNFNEDDLATALQDAGVKSANELHYGKLMPDDIPQKYQDWNQQILQQKYGDTVTLYRGVSLNEAEKMNLAASGSVAAYPKTGTSWTDNLETAKLFSEGNVHEYGGQEGSGVVLQAKIPTESVYFSYHLLPRFMDKLLGENEYLLKKTVSPLKMSIKK